MYIHDDDILVVLENDECLIKSYFSNDKKYLYTEKEDKYSLAVIIIGFILFTFCITISIWFSIMLIFALLSHFFEYLSSKITTHKNITQGGDIDH